MQVQQLQQLQLYIGLTPDPYGSTDKIRGLRPLHNRFGYRLIGQVTHTPTVTGGTLT